MSKQEIEEEIRRRETTFENARLGQEVEDVCYGLGVIVSTGLDTPPGLAVNFSGPNYSIWYTSKGLKDVSGVLHRTLYWPGSIIRHKDGRVEINPQPRPARTRTLEITAYAVISPRGDILYMTDSYVEATRERGYGHNIRIAKLAGRTIVEVEE